MNRKPQPTKYFKLTPEVHKEIKLIVSKLPKLQKTDKDGKPIFRMLNKYVGSKDVDLQRGTYKKQSQHYTEPVLVNHEINLIGQYEEMGRKGIDNYVTYVEEILKRDKQKSEEANDKNN